MSDDEPVLKPVVDRGVVRQANALVKSAQLMDLNEKRMVMLAMSRIRWGDKEFLTQDIPVTELARWIGGNPYQEGRKAADGLLHRVVEVMEEGGGRTKFQWTTLSSYIPAHKHKDGVACVRIRFNEELAPFLLELRERYNQIPLMHMLPMPSYNSQRLYEILWHDSHAGKKEVLSYAIDQIKTFIGLKDPGGKWEKYKSWKDFKKVLEKAVEDFNQHGNLKITRYAGKSLSKRSYSHVYFYLHLAESAEPVQPEPAEVDLDATTMTLVSELEKLGYMQDPLEAIRSYGAEVVSRALRLTYEAQRKGDLTNRPIHNPGGLLASLLKQGVPAESIGPDRVNVRELAQELMDAFAVARYAWADTFWSEGSEAFRADFPGIMQLELSSFQLKQLERANWQGALFDNTRRELLLKLYPDEVPDELVELSSYAASVDFFRDVDEDTAAAVLRGAEDLL